MCNCLGVRARQPRRRATAAHSDRRRADHPAGRHRRRHVLRGGRRHQHPHHPRRRQRARNQASWSVPVPYILLINLKKRVKS